MFNWKINWKLRFQNKATLVSLVILTIAFVYDALAILDITPRVSEGQVMELFNLVVKIVAAVGVIIDPTTKGVNDSPRALKYEDLGGEE